MRTLTTADLFSMEVINLCDGARLGCPVALELDCDDGKISALLLPQSTGFSLFCKGKNEYYRIPWCKIQCIGEDTVLVNITAGELNTCACKRPKGIGFFG